MDQLPVTGHSFASVLADAEAPAANDLQYWLRGRYAALSPDDRLTLDALLAGTGCDTRLR